MAKNVYEGMFILDTTKVAGDVAAADAMLRGILERHGGEILHAGAWDERRFTYPIEGQKKGLFYLIYFSAPGATIAEVERDCAINEWILRKMIIKIDPKLVEAMLNVAKGGHAGALHNYTEENQDNSALAGIPELEHRRRD